MYPHSHFLFALAIGLFLYGEGILTLPMTFLCAIFAVLIDIDHYIVYIMKHGDWNIFNAWNASAGSKENDRSVIHHWQGFLVISVLILVLFLINTKLAIIAAVAYYSHMTLDLAHFNIFRIGKRIGITFLGLKMNILAYEIGLDVILLILIGFVI